MARLYFADTLRRVALLSAFSDRTFRQLDANLFRLTSSLAERLSIEHASAAGDAIGRALGPRLRQHENVLRNLRLAFPDRSEAWVATTARAIWGRIFQSLAEYPHLPAIANAEGEPRVEVVTHVDLGPARRGEQRLMMVAIHQANWNVHAIAGHLAGLAVSVLVIKQANEHLEPLISRYRDRMPGGFIEVSEGLRGVVKALESGHHIGMFMDVRDEAQPMVPFFGHPAPTTVWPARLALKLGLVLVPVQLERLPGARFRATFHSPVKRDPRLDDPREAAVEMTARLNAQFEQWIRHCPKDWICAKRRWPIQTWKKRRDELQAMGRLPKCRRSAGLEQAGERS